MPTDYDTNNLTINFEDSAIGYLKELDCEPVFTNISADYYSPTHILRKLIEDVEMCKRKCGINIEIDDEISDDNQALDQFLGEFIQQGGDINKGSL
jgi:hypothetical protein